MYLWPKGNPAYISVEKFWHRTELSQINKAQEYTFATRDTAFMNEKYVGA